MLATTLSLPQVSLLAISSLDDFLTGCAALVFGLGLYELFISNLDYVRCLLHIGLRGSSDAQLLQPGERECRFFRSRTARLRRGGPVHSAWRTGPCG